MKAAAKKETSKLWHYELRLDQDLKTPLQYLAIERANREGGRASVNRIINDLIREEVKRSCIRERMPKQ